MIQLTSITVTSHSSIYHAYREIDSVHNIILYYVSVHSDFHDKIQQIKSVAAVRDVAHVRVPRVGLGAVCHVRAQGNWQARGQRVLRGPLIFNTFLDRCVSGHPIHGPMAVRCRHVRDAVSAQHRVTTGQDVQPVYNHRVDHLSYCWSQPTRHQDVVSMVT